MTATTSRNSTIAEATSFLTSLFHDDRNSLYAHATRTDKSGWRQINVKSKDFINAFESGSFNRYADQYVSTSGFISAKRRVSNLRQVNAIMIDIDHHEESYGDCLVATQRDFEKLWDSIFFGELSKYPALIPTYIVATGRGHQIWYILERSIPCDGSMSSKKALLLREKFLELIWQYFERLLGVIPDKACSDASRVGRIPGTWNTKARAMARMVFESNVYTNLTPALEALTELLEVKQAPVSHNHTIKHFEPLLHDRAASLRSLRDSRKATGAPPLRDELTFAYAEVVVRKYSKEDALSALKEFNCGFNHPLNDKEIISIFKQACSRFERGYKVFGAKKLKEHLAMTEDEATRFFGKTTKRELERLEARRRKAERNKRIKAMWLQGISQERIALAVGYARRTVCRVIARLKEALERQKQAWEEALQTKTHTSVPFSPTYSSEVYTGGDTMREISNLYPCFGVLFDENDFSMPLIPLRSSP